LSKHIDLAYDHESYVRTALNIGNIDSEKLENWKTECKDLIEPPNYRAYTKIHSGGLHSNEGLNNCYRKLNDLYNEDLTQRKMRIEGSELITEKFQNVPIINVKVRGVFYRQFLFIAFIYILIQILFNIKSLTSILDKVINDKTLAKDLGKIKIFINHSYPNYIIVSYLGIILPGFLTISFLIYDVVYKNFDLFRTYAFTKEFEILLSYQFYITITLLIVTFVLCFFNFKSLKEFTKKIKVID